MCSRRVKVSTWPIILGLWSAAFDMMSGLESYPQLFFRFVVANSWMPFSEAAWVDFFFLDLQNLTDYDSMIDCTILYMIVTGTLDEKALAPPWMTYVCFYYSHIYIHIYIVLWYIPFIKNGIFTTSLPQLDVFAGRRLVRLPTPPIFSGSAAGRKVPWSLGCCGACHCTDRRSNPLGLHNRESAGSCRLQWRASFFLLPIRVHIKSQFEEVERFF